MIRRPGAVADVELKFLFGASDRHPSCGATRTPPIESGASLPSTFSVNSSGLRLSTGRPRGLVDERGESLGCDVDHGSEGGLALRMGRRGLGLRLALSALTLV
jgi:hypothetical protein